jgi:tubulin-specific chaperone A
VKKDLEYYAKEHAAQSRKIETMRAENKDAYDIKKQEEVLVETETMLPDCQMRLKEAASDVASFLAAHKDELDGSEVAIEAKTLLDAVPALLQ